MLSRVAENIYWMGRYLERAENTARLVSVTLSLLLDNAALGEKAPVASGWQRLITLTGSQHDFARQPREYSEEEVCHFFLVDRQNNGSVFSSLHGARENLRATREVFPRELWEYVNDLYLLVSQWAEQGMVPGERHGFLSQVIQKCQKISGLLHSTMSQDSALHFLHMGQYLERADMTTRILDARAINLKGVEEDGPEKAYENSLWLIVLRSVSGEQMYRRHMNPRIVGLDVLRFLLKDNRFPRAFRRCIHEVDQGLSHLARHDLPRAIAYRIDNLIQTCDTRQLLTSGLHDFLDFLQIQLAQLHDQIAHTYFNHAHRR